ncbi:MAG: stage II sporulation protein P [Christensenellales bacterium]|nr:stage II sporulation protein P [Christensenellales bacterium]
MVRFKVVKGSHLLLAIAIIILCATVTGILFGLYANHSSPTNQLTEDSAQVEARTGSVLASTVEQASLSDKTPVTIEVIAHENERKPRILIYHTHTHEAYEQVDYARYDAIEAWRTTDTSHSVVRVGQELAALLEARGFEVTHDTTDHELNELSTSYTRSLETLQSYTSPFDLYLDLHRDAYVEGTSKNFSTSDGQQIARLMLLIGNGEGFQEKPYYKQNLAFAEALTERINFYQPNLCKDVMVKNGRYNQNIGVFSVLVEVGHNKNTLEEALRALPYLADGLTDLMIMSPDESLQEMQQSYQTKQYESNLGH